MVLETNIYNPPAWPGIIGREHEIRAVLNTPANFRDWLKSAGFQNFLVMPAPSFTPAGPFLLNSFLDLLDNFFCENPETK